jgi:hypothetical protein
MYNPSLRFRSGKVGWGRHSEVLPASGKAPIFDPMSLSAAHSFLLPAGLLLAGLLLRGRAH